MHLLIAGGAGFVGSQLAFYCKQQYPHYHIIALDNLSRNGSQLNVPRLQAAGIQFVKADTRFPEQLASLPAVDMVIDTAAEPSVLAGLDGGGLDYLIHTNFNGTVHLLDVARKHGAGFLFLSTSRVYPYTVLEQLPVQQQGLRFTLPAQGLPAGYSANGITEAASLSGVRSLYGATKLASELMVAEYGAAFGIPTLINRFGVLAGPWQMGKVDQGVTALWLAKHFYNQQLQYIGFGGQGLQVRDILHIADACRLIDYEMHHLQALQGQTFNAGGGLSSSASLAELTQYCQQLTGNTIPITSVAQNRPADIPWYITDNSAITAATGWAPQKTVPDILADTLAWMQQHAEELRPILG